MDNMRRLSIAIAIAIAITSGCTLDSEPGVVLDVSGEECSHLSPCDQSLGIAPGLGGTWVACVTDLGVVCPPNQPCYGTCHDMADPALECPQGFDRCNEEGFCTDITVSRDHCGGCGNTCPGDLFRSECREGECCLWNDDYTECT